MRKKVWWRKIWLGHFYSDYLLRLLNKNVSSSARFSPTNAQIKIYLVAVRTHSIYCIVFSCGWAFSPPMRPPSRLVWAILRTNDAAQDTSNRRTEAEAEGGGRRSSQKLFFFHLSSLAAVNKTCREQLAVIFIPSRKIFSPGEEDGVIILNVNLFNCEKLSD